MIQISKKEKERERTSNGENTRGITENKVTGRKGEKAIATQMIYNYNPISGREHSAE